MYLKHTIETQNYFQSRQVTELNTNHWKSEGGWAKCPVSIWQWCVTALWTMSESSLLELTFRSMSSDLHLWLLWASVLHYEPDLVEAVAEYNLDKQKKLYCLPQLLCLVFAKSTVHYSHCWEEEDQYSAKELPDDDRLSYIYE